MITDKRTEYLNSEILNCCTLFNFRQSLRSADAPRTKDLLKYKIKNLGTNMRMFLPEKQSKFLYIHVVYRSAFFAYALNTQILPHLKVSPFEAFFYPQPRNPLQFQLILSQNQFR